VEEQVNRQLDTLRQRITTYYQAYADNPNMILSPHHYLFTSRTLEERLSSPYDIMAAWIRSVEEAIQVLQHHTASLRAEAHQIFPQQNEATDPESDSTYTSESEESDDALSLAPTETTAATTNSSSTNDLLSSSSITLLVSRDDSNTSYDDDALSLTSVPSIDTGSSNVEFTSVAFEDLDRHSAT
jgi:cytoskeletal protein RodZ